MASELRRRVDAVDDTEVCEASAGQLLIENRQRNRSGSQYIFDGDRCDRREQSMDMWEVLAGLLVV